MKNLNGLPILVTRPRPQATHLVQLIQEQGGEPIMFPCVEIIQTDIQRQTAKQGIEALKQADFAIFTSRNAVYFAFLSLQGVHKCDAETLGAATWIAVGRSTQTALQQAGIDQVMLPKQSNSEGILALDQLQKIDSKNVLIFTGENSRPLLADTLKKRGAHVTVVPVYQRICPNNDAMPVIERINENMIIICTSVESLHNLYHRLSKVSHRLIELPLIVVSERIKTAALQLGWRTIYVTDYVSDQSILNSIFQYSSNNGMGLAQGY